MLSMNLDLMPMIVRPRKAKMTRSMETKMEMVMLMRRKVKKVSRKSSILYKLQINHVAIYK